MNVIGVVFVKIFGLVEVMIDVDDVYGGVECVK